MIKIKRVYEKPIESDGFRILVDRLWPRGLSKEKAKIDLWLKDIAPSTELRKWFGHDPGKWDEFRDRYQSELSKKPELINKILNFEEPLTLIYAAKDKEHNNASVLAELLKSRLNISSDH